MDPPVRLQESVEENRTRILNITGSRESKEPGIHHWVMSVLETAEKYEVPLEELEARAGKDGWA